jgi:hypothetical protein
LYYVLTTTLFSELKMITKTAEVTNLVRYSFKYAEDNTQEGIDTAALIIKIAAAVDNGATIAEAVVQHVPPEYQLAAVDDLYKIATSNLPAVIPPKQPQRLLGHDPSHFSQEFKDAWRAKMRAEEAQYRMFDNGDGTYSDIYGRVGDRNGRWSYTHHDDGTRTDTFGRTVDADNRPIGQSARQQSGQQSGRPSGRPSGQRFGQGLSKVKGLVSRHPYAAAGVGALGLAAAGYGAYKALRRPTNTEQQQTPQQQ